MDKNAMQPLRCIASFVNIVQSMLRTGIRLERPARSERVAREVSIRIGLADRLGHHAREDVAGRRADCHGRSRDCARVRHAYDCPGHLNRAADEVGRLYHAVDRGRGDVAVDSQRGLRQLPVGDGEQPEVLRVVERIDGDSAERAGAVRGAVVLNLGAGRRHRRSRAGRGVDGDSAEGDFLAENRLDRAEHDRGQRGVGRRDVVHFRCNYLAICVNCDQESVRALCFGDVPDGAVFRRIGDFPAAGREAVVICLCL